MENTVSTIIASEKSTHFVETFVLGAPKRHENADTLSLFSIGDTAYVYVAKTEDWVDKIGTLVCWVPPDSIVDLSRPEFSFLDKPRVRAKRIRGVVSYGLLIPAPKDSGLKPGDNGANILNITHYDPEESTSRNTKGFSLPSGEVASPPTGVFPKYDVDAFLKYHRVFIDNEEVFVTEKLHGANSRFCFVDGTIHCGSRNEWKKEFTQAPNITLEALTEKLGSEKAIEVFTKAVTNFKPRKSQWWTVLGQNPSIEALCRANPGWCIYGEIYGNIKGFKYDIKDGMLGFRAFDILTNNTSHPWLDSDEFMNICTKFSVPTVPLLAVIPYNFDKLVAMSEGNTTLGNHIREGVVCKPRKSRWDGKLGRVNLKIINPAYLEKN